MEAPPADVAPRFCQKHFTSQQREKIDPLMRPCQKCSAQITSTYSNMTLCPPCSNTEESCMICGAHAPVASNYIPPKTLNSQAGAAPPGMLYAMPDPAARPGSTLPPPPPSASHSPSRQDFWHGQGCQSPSQFPPPPPPPPSNRNLSQGGGRGALTSDHPSISDYRAHADRGHGDFKENSRRPRREKLVMQGQGTCCPPYFLCANGHFMSFPTSR